MEPIQQVLGFRVEIELQVAHSVAAIGEKGDLLIQLHTMALEHLEESSFTLAVIRLHEAKAFTGSFLWNGFVHDHFKMSLLVIPLSNVTAINSDGNGRWRSRQCGPLTLASVDKGKLFFVKRIILHKGT
jgi:hypothetical protein